MTEALLTVLEEIALDVVATIAAVTVANGWNSNAVPVRYTGQEIPITDQLVIVSQGDAQMLPEQDHVEETWDQTFHCECYLTPPESNTTTPIDTRRNILGADVAKALTQDPSLYRNNWAQDTSPQSRVNVTAPTGEWMCVIVSVVVRYSTVWRDPYTSLRRNP